jgi:hypothetical protein
MAEPRAQLPVLLVVASFSRHERALAWGREKLEAAYGPVGLASEPFDFLQTTYYETTMGAGLRKQLLCFRDLLSADGLPPVKLHTNALERELAEARLFEEERPLNLDPGLLSLGKFMLATTKDQSHRIYLSQGIFAEVTLRYEAREFVPWPWTYADYRQDCVRTFLNKARDYYRGRLRETA